jgi:hypothetical protein
MAGTTPRMATTPLNTPRYTAYNTNPRHTTTKARLAPSPTKNGEGAGHKAKDRVTPEEGDLEGVGEWTAGSNQSIGSRRPRRTNHGIHCAPKADAPSSCMPTPTPFAVQGLHEQPRRRLQEGNVTVVPPSPGQT